MIDVLVETKPTVRGRYLHWDKLRHLDPPPGLSSQEWWLVIKLARGQMLRALPLLDEDGEPFRFAITDEALEMLLQIDQQASGQIALSEAVTNPESRRRYLVSSLIEEAITSSQLEGAATSRRVAKDMLRSGRRPKTHGERMIINNYLAMNYVRDRVGKPLTPDVVLELHRIVTADTLQNGAAGRLQTPEEERISVLDEAGKVLHSPPPAEQLPARLEALCAFANGETASEGFLHPVVRAVVVHFWLGYDHPFEDGNGRVARALFYWSMLHQGYWLAEYLSISRILKMARARYARSFIYSEIDENDLTYFVLYQLSVITRAIRDLSGYLQRKMHEVRETERLLKTGDFNYRQVALLSHALRRPDANYTFKSHARSHNVVYESARNDLLDLQARGLLEKAKIGRAHHFFPVPQLGERLQRA